MRRGVGCLVALGLPLALVLAGCAAVTPENLVGAFQDSEGGVQVMLQPDGTMEATSVPPEVVGLGSGSPGVELSGEWELVDDDFVYLTIDDGSSAVAGLQLYVSSTDRLYFRADPDGPPTVVLERQG